MPQAVAKVVSSFPFGVMSNEHDSALKIYISCLAKMRIKDALVGAPNYVNWQVRRDNFTVLSFFEHDRILQRHRHLPAFWGPDVELVKPFLIRSVCMCRSLWSRTMQHRRSSPSWTRKILGSPRTCTPRVKDTFMLRLAALVEMKPLNS